MSLLNETVVRLAAIAAPPVSEAGEGRVYFDSTSNTFKVSSNGGAYLDMATGVTLQTAYDGGSSISASGAVTMTGSGANNNNVLEVSKTPAGSQSGNGVVVSMGANATGVAAVFSGATTSSAVVHVGNGVSAASPVAGSVLGTSASAAATAGGGLAIAAGSGNTTGAGGVVRLTGGTGGATNGTGGDAVISGGLSGAAAGTGGGIVLRTARSGAGTTLVDRLTVGADGGLTATGVATANAPAVSAGSAGTVYFNSTQQRFLISENGAAYRLLAPFQQSVASTSTITTTSTTDVLATGMTLTPEAGTYIVWFNGSAGNSSGTSTTTMSIYSGGSQVTASERVFVATRVLFAGTRVPFCCSSVTTVDGSQAIEGRWRVSTGTGTMLHKTLVIMRIA